MLKCVLGLEIGSSNIKIIEVVKKGTVLEVRRFSLLNTPKDCIINGVISNIEPIRQIIADELKHKNYKAKKVVAVVQSSSIIIRNAVMDKQPEKLIRQLLEVKTEDYLPVERGQYQIDFKITGEFDEGGVTKNRLLLVAAPNSVVTPVADLIKMLKLVPIMISIPSESLGHIFTSEARMIYGETSNVMILDIGGSSTTLTIVSNEAAVLTRMIDFGVEHINEIINNPDVAARIHEGEEFLTTIIKPEIEYNIVAEVERILQFYYSSYTTGVIKKVYLIGGGAEIMGIIEYIRDALNIPTERLNRFDTLKDSTGMNFEKDAKFFVNILGAINGL